jgi:hypothetical protein
VLGSVGHIHCGLMGILSKPHSQYHVGALALRNTLMADFSCDVDRWLLLLIRVSCVHTEGCEPGRPSWQAAHTRCTVAWMVSHWVSKLT